MIGRIAWCFGGGLEHVVGQRDIRDVQCRERALIDGATGAVTTHAELRDRVRATAAGLAQRGIGPGDVVGIDSPNL